MHYIWRGHIYDDSNLPADAVESLRARGLLDSGKSLVDVDEPRHYDQPEAEIEPVADPTAVSGPAADDLTVIKGIGAVRQADLNAMGITSYAQLAGADAEALAVTMEVSRAVIDGWIAAAVDLERQL